MMDWNGNMTGAGWTFSVLAMILMLAIIAAALVWGARRLGGRPNAESPAEASAEDILDHRLASSEIKTEQ